MTNKKKDPRTIKIEELKSTIKTQDAIILDMSIAMARNSSQIADMGARMTGLNNTNKKYMAITDSLRAQVELLKEIIIKSMGKREAMEK